MLRHSSDVACVDFSPDGHLIASGTCYATGLIIWNWRDGTKKTLKGVLGNINDIRFSPNGQYIAAGMDGWGGVVIWHVRTGQLVAELKRDFNERVYRIAFMPDGMGLVSVGSNGVNLWHISLFGMECPASRLRNGRIEVDKNNGKEPLNFGADGVRHCCL